MPSGVFPYWAEGLLLGERLILGVSVALGLVLGLSYLVLKVVHR